MDDSGRDDETLTVEEAAAFLKVDPVTVQRELKAKRLPGAKVGRSWRILKSDLSDYLFGGGRFQDPWVMMLIATQAFRERRKDDALKALVAGISDPAFPAEYRRVFSEPLTVLQQACDADDP